MIKLSDLILERFELPTEFKMKLENTVYSALGNILTPYMEKFKKNMFSNKQTNDKSYSGLKNVIETVRKFTESKGGNTKITFTDVLIPDFYALTKEKSEMRKISVTIEKSSDDIYVESNEKKDRLFPNFVVSKDYAGWDLKRINDFWKKKDASYQHFKSEFDERMVSVEDLINKLNKWKQLDKPLKLKNSDINISLYFEKTLSDENQPYFHYFRVLPSSSVESYNAPNHFSPTDPPYIVQTIYVNDFDPTVGLSIFMQRVHKTIVVSEHEGRHLIQHYGNINKQLKGDYYGGPKKNLRHKLKPKIRGIDPSGVASPDSLYKEPDDESNRVLHPLRSVEFKTNLYSYKEEIEKFLKQNLPTSRWKEGFRDVVNYAIDKLTNKDFVRKYKSSYEIDNTVLKKHLKNLFDIDRDKFNQMIRELYKLFF